MSLSIDAWSHLTKYTGPPCGDETQVLRDSIARSQAGLEPLYVHFTHARLHTDPKTADEIREEFGLEPDVCYEGAEHMEFDLGYGEYDAWLDWLESWNPEARMAIHGGDDDNAHGSREAEAVLEALNLTLFETTFGSAEIDFGDDGDGGYEGAEVIYRNFVKAYGLAAQGGLISFR